MHIPNTIRKSQMRLSKHHCDRLIQSVKMQSLLWRWDNVMVVPSTVCSYALLGRSAVAAVATQIWSCQAVDEEIYLGGGWWRHFLVKDICLHGSSGCQQTPWHHVLRGGMATPYWPTLWVLSSRHNDLHGLSWFRVQNVTLCMSLIWVTV